MTAMTKEKAHRIASTVAIRDQAFINGAFQDARSGKRFETINPATNEVIASVSHCDSGDVDVAVTGARKAFDSGA